MYVVFYRSVVLVAAAVVLATVSQDSGKGGAVETGCSDLYAVIF